MDISLKSENLVNDAWKKCEDYFSEIQQNGSIIGDSSPIRLNDITGYGPTDISYSSYLNEKIDLSFFPKYSEIDKKLLILSDSINFLQMSRYLKEDHEKTYVAPNKIESDIDIEKLLDSSDFVTLNYSKSRIDNLYAFWRNKALSLAQFDKLDRIDKYRASHLNRFIIVGKPGVGKTAFINYLFSVKSDDLITNKIIWIRVHISGNRRDKYTMLLDRLHVKFLKIFCQFYLYFYEELNETFINNFESYLIETIFLQKKYERLEEKDKVELIINYIDMLRSIHDETKAKIDVKINYEKFGIDLKFAREINELLIYYLQKNLGYSFIFIFDGLDSVTIDYVQYNEYKEWMEEIDEVTNNSFTNYKALYIVSMRDYSFISFFLNHLKEDRSDLKRYAILDIHPMSLNEVLSKKYELAARNLKRAGFDYKMEEVKNINLNLMKLLFFYFSGFDVSESPVDICANPDHHFQVFMKLNNDNLRSVMRFFRELLIMTYTVFKDSAFSNLISDPEKNTFITNFEGKEWILYRVLLFGGCTHSVYRNRVRYNCQGCAEISSNNKAILPNVFNYRDFIQENKPKLPKNLVKIRIIQYLLSVDRATIVDAIDWVKNNFAYLHDDLRHETREMIYNGLIIPCSKETELIIAELANTNYMIKLSELSSIILKKIIRKAIYYEIVVDDTPIQIEFAHGMKPLSRYDSEVNLSEYLIKKSKYIILFVLYLNNLEKNDLKNYLRINETNEEDYINKNLSIFTEDVILSIKKDMIKYIAGYLNKLKSRGALRPIELFISDWYKEFQISEKEIS
jgi:hypothetical protein